MSEECSHNCSSCSSDCASREDLKAKANAGSHVKKVIGIISGKGGVGKSLVTSLLAVEMRREGYSSAILDADITGPSIPKAFGVSGPPAVTDEGIQPVKSRTGIPVMSINLLLENETDPVIWRGPVVAGVIKQFWSDVAWGDVDFLFVDMPPGTGDVPLTVFQSLPVDGIIVVSSPQELVGMIVEKAVKMADMMKVPVLGLVENMSYFVCPDCNSKHMIFGDSNIQTIAQKYGIHSVSKLPMNMKFSRAADGGNMEAVCCEELSGTIQTLLKLL